MAARPERPGPRLPAALLAALLLSQAAPPVPPAIRAEPHAPVRQVLHLDGAVVEASGAAEDAAGFAQVVRLLPAAVRAAGRWGPVPPTLVVTVHAGHEGLERATGQQGRAWMRAWSRTGSVDLQSPRTWTRGHASDAALGQLLVHELTHCVLLHAAGPSRFREIPFWFREGMATVAAGERHGAPLAEAIIDPAPFLRGDPAVAYATADRAFRDLLRQHGERAVRGLLSRLAAGRTFPEAFEAVTGAALAAWERDVAVRLSALAANG